MKKVKMCSNKPNPDVVSEAVSEVIKLKIFLGGGGGGHAPRPP